jgi:hypothetical protein
LSIGVIGSGALGSNVARAFAARGLAATMAKQTLDSVDIVPFATRYGNNSWATVKTWRDSVCTTAAIPVAAKYTGVLAADVFTTTTNPSRSWNPSDWISGIPARSTSEGRAKARHAPGVPRAGGPSPADMPVLPRSVPSPQATL